LGHNQQAVEAVVIELADAYGTKGGDQLLGHPWHRNALQGVVLEVEVLEPGRGAVRKVEAVGSFGDDAQAEVLEGRPHFGYGQGFTPAGDAEGDGPGRA